MGSITSYICKKCGAKFRLQDNPTWCYNYRCSSCGIVYDSYEDLADKNCPCGGTFREFKNMVCPSCKSEELEVDKNGFFAFTD